MMKSYAMPLTTRLRATPKLTLVSSNIPKKTIPKRPPDIHDVAVNYPPDIHCLMPSWCHYRFASCIKLLHLMS